ncbi:hypothetical protein FHS92_000585 [Sphingobium subterraneum]|uniref:Ketoreductase domain-containing protein n=2 Tax=Sphingobium subterraneum TaxID=627688 RepID=A0A841J2Y9_9SPHN|nr:hypothetical protein [Sphingobium subterraneum]
MAERLAEFHGANLVLVGRRRDLLDSLAAKVRGHGREARVMALDLSAAADTASLIAEVDGMADIAAVVLCAGITYFGDAMAMSPAEIERVNSLNVSSTATLLLGFARIFGEQRVPGRILVVSSMSALIPLPFQAAYSASKSYIRSLVIALRAEWTRSDISMTIAYPLGMDTEMTRGSGLQKLVEGKKFGSIPVTRCADRAIDDLIRRRPVSLVGLTSRILYVLAMMVPDTWLTQIAGRVYKNAWVKQGAVSLSSNDGSLDDSGVCRHEGPKF